MIDNININDRLLSQILDSYLKKNVSALKYNSLLLLWPALS